MNTYTFEQIAKELGVTVEEIKQFAIDEGLINNDGSITEKGIESGFLVDEINCIQDDKLILAIISQDDDDVYILPNQGITLKTVDFIIEASKMIAQGYTVNVYKHIKVIDTESDLKSFQTDFQLVKKNLS